MAQPLGPADTIRESDLQYGGDVTVDETWEHLCADPDACLVDVRTVAEWSYVGVPDLSGCGKEAVLVEWQSFPSMTVDPDFVHKVGGTIPNREAPVFLLCRSGARSKAAAIALTAAGYGQCFNVSGGFEGPPDANKHRGRLDGWKARGLPWVQG